MNWNEILPYALLWALGPALVCVILWLMLWWFMARQVRWFEETGLFLDTVEAGVSEELGLGRALEGVAAEHGRAVSPAWQRVVADLREGRRLGEALDRTPEMLPAPIAGMLKAGEQTGQWRPALAGARIWLQPSVGRISPWEHGVVFNAVALTLLGGGFAWLLGSSVFDSISVAMRRLDAQPPGLMAWLQNWFPGVIAGQAVFAVVIVVLALTCCGGPRFGLWLERTAPAVARAWLHALPWRRKRALRDFSVMLAVQLDTGVPEEIALRQAAEWSSGGQWLRRETDAAIAELRAGVWLPEALRHFDLDAELHWRLSLAVTRAGGFSEALLGWQESLEARAQQQESVVSGALVLWGELANAILVALLAVAVFRMMVVMAEMTWLW